MGKFRMAVLSVLLVVGLCLLLLATTTSASASEPALNDVIGTQLAVGDGPAPAAFNAVTPSFGWSAIDPLRAGSAERASRLLRDADPLLCG